MEQFFKSYMYYTTDPQNIPNALRRGFNVIAIVNPEEMKFYPGCIAMSNLLPSPSNVINLINTDRTQPDYQEIVKKYLYDYQLYLSLADREDSIVALLASLYKTSHSILLFVEYESDQQFMILYNILEFFKNCFGIIGADYKNLYNNDPKLNPGFVPDPKFIFNVIDLLFVNGYINKYEYAKFIPNGAVPSPRASSILLSDYNYAFPNLKASMIAVYNIVTALKQEALTGKKVLAIVNTEQLDSAIMSEIEYIVNNTTAKFKPNPIQPLLK